MKNDSQLQNDVMAELQWKMEWQPKIDASHISVAALNNVITLSGQVVHTNEKKAAGATAKGVYGVKAVANELVVEPNGSQLPTDQDIVEAVLSALKWDYDVPAGAVKVIVKDGWVTLEGTVDWLYQKVAVRRCVRDLLGVKAVTNSITLKPTARWIND